VAVDLWISVAEKTEEEVGSGSLPEPVFYAKVFEACIELGDFDSAHRLARRAAWSVPAGSSGSSKLLALARWLARRQKIDEAMECIKQVRQTGNAVDLRTMKSLIVVCAQLGQVDLGKNGSVQYDGDGCKRASFWRHPGVAHSLMNLLAAS